MTELDKLSLSELLVLKQLISDEKRRIINMAREKGIIGKVKNIVTTFGKRFPKNYGNYWVYIIPENLMDRVRDIGDVLGLVKDVEMVIIYDDYGCNMDVYHKGKKVFYVHLTNIEKVCVGEWMDIVDKLHRKAVKKREERERHALIKEIMEEVDEWGMDLGELVKKAKYMVKQS